MSTINLAQFSLGPSTHEEHERLCREVVTSTFVSLLDRLQQLRAREAALSTQVERDVATIDVGLLHAIDAQELRLTGLIYTVCHGRQRAAHLARTQQLHEHVWKANTRLQGILRRHAAAANAKAHEARAIDGSSKSSVRRRTATLPPHDDADDAKEAGRLTTSSTDGGPPSSPSRQSSAQRPVSGYRRVTPRRATARQQPVVLSDSDDDSIDGMMTARLEDTAAFEANGRTVRLPSRGRKQQPVLRDDEWHIL
jgi:hypothetical protein